MKHSMIFVFYIAQQDCIHMDNICYDFLVHRQEIDEVTLILIQTAQYLL